MGGLLRPGVLGGLHERQHEDDERVVQGESANVSASAMVPSSSPPASSLSLFCSFGRWSSDRAKGSRVPQSVLLEPPGLRCRACPRFAHAAEQEIIYLLGI